MVTRMAGTDATAGPGPVPTGPLAGTRFRIEWVVTTGSTNADLLAAADRGDAEGLVLVADHQSAGRGRRDRSWEAPPGSSLLLSVMLRPDIEPARAGVLTAGVGLAARAACHAVAEVDPGLKWPNDLVAETPRGERKLGGILAESRVAGDRLAAVVVGLGLNVAWPRSVPEDLADLAVSLGELRPSGGPVDRGELATTLLADLEGRLRTVEAGDDATVWADWRQASVTLGRPVRVETGDGMLVGSAEDVTDRGRLLVRRVDGPVAEVDVGDVIHVRTGEG